MKDGAFLGLDPHRFGLSNALADDIELIDALLGTVLGLSIIGIAAAMQSTG
jgi:hypothetical protein